MLSEYDLQTKEFLQKTGTKFKAKFLKHDYYFIEDKDTRDIYRITLKNSKGRYSFNFGQSISNMGKIPSEYDVLACLTKFGGGSFEDFCIDFGYDIDSRTAEKIYKTVQKEVDNLYRIFTEEELKLLAEIN